MVSVQPGRQPEWHGLSREISDEVDVENPDTDTTKDFMIEIRDQY